MKLVDGVVRTTPSVPASVIELLAVSVLLFAIVSVAAVAGLVSVRLENAGSAAETPTSGLSVAPTLMPLMSTPVVKTGT